MIGVPTLAQRFDQLLQDGLADVPASVVQPTDRLTAPFVGRPLIPLHMSAEALIEMENDMVETLNPKLQALAARAGGKDKLSADSYYEAVESVRVAQLGKLGDKLVSVADLRALARSSDGNLNLVLGAFDIDQQLPAGVSIKLPGGVSERQQGDTSSVLNKLGAEGWELVSYHSSGAGTWGFEQFWLKRQSES